MITNHRTEKVLSLPLLVMKTCQPLLPRFGRILEADVQDFALQKKAQVDQFSHRLQALP